MAYSKYKWALSIRVMVLFFLLLGLAFTVSKLDFNTNLSIAIIITLLMAIIAVFSFLNLYRFIMKRFAEMDDFFESVKYRDFSRWFNETSGSQDIRTLHKGFNEVNKTINAINYEKEAQHLYLQKILELVDTGIIAYNIESGEVLWGNDAFKNILNVPSLKTIHFIKDRKPDLYKIIFENNYAKGDDITINIDNEKVKILISSSVFLIENINYKLIVLQNIEDTLNRNESEAWRKLLSVMTHEIMNSIAPISSLAETLQSKVGLSIQDSDNYPLDMNDLDIGIESIKKRSEGLLKFAKTYRSLNKVTTLNLSKILVGELFDNIKTLMLPSFKEKDTDLIFESENTTLEIEIDTYLIEQVLINLILNAVEACKGVKNPKIIIQAKKTIGGQTVLKITDNGKGIPDEIIDNIFVPFFTTKKTGSGIGLSLCKQIMLLHKGNIQIKSIEHKGTSVSLMF
ncbi:HAMP domain-containing sensor histidine kinase [Flavivirga aquimarina]|uniref:histidine kinase n=1 Tax=Flavivirga aquimarina TaxID=2027862 RepID=A0ABT8WCT9_9FLAO|nr:HAMP domain-containing sensor histidine kinase [Flavivirga aquimarina]MDO5970842.1 HAMP domain-containing sensor histidine kinase [Flavivirga aquimarina]